MKQKATKPVIRFAGFTDDWEQRKLGDIGTTYNGLSGKTKEDFGRGNAEFVTYLNVFNNPLSDIKLTENVEVDKKQNEVKYGDVFFTTSSETPEEVGMSSVWLDSRPNVYLNSFCFGYRFKEKIYPYYAAYMLRSNSIRRELIILAQGISRYNISKVKSMEISVPIVSYPEQQKIGNFFKQLDDTIALHQRQLEA
ncbi:restriction endonuclease subunit S, partial [Vagococcus sp.]|uniref:restriction endonuclease subunit S n=1 Tax=Vagococcus sp. TaxID=1933889 RepID=UPI000EBD73B3